MNWPSHTMFQKVDERGLSSVMLRNRRGTLTMTVDYSCKLCNREYRDVSGIGKGDDVTETVVMDAVEAAISRHECASSPMEMG